MLKARQKKGAESKELFDDLVKRGYTAIRSVKQVSMICIGLRNRDILISEQVRLQGKIRSDWKRKIYWRINPDYFTAHHRCGINPDFYRTHPDGAFTINLSLKEMNKAIKQRTKPKKKATKK